MRSSTFSSRWHLSGWLALSLTWLSGCQTLPTLSANDPTQTDRLIRMYPELRSGRFAVISDYENDHHMELVQLSGASPEARSVLDVKRGRSETGRHCLSFIAGSEHDAVVLNNDRAENWFLKRDWREYDLLMMSVYSPVPHAQLQLTVSAGRSRDRLSVETQWQLLQGWNELSADLADVRDRIPLDDVREIRLSLSEVMKPINLLLDDIILAGHQETMFGDPENKEGHLYAQRVGRHWRIGAGAAFELVFANGQIVGWYQLSGDPNRLHNLCEKTTLGPIPISEALSSSTKHLVDNTAQHVAVRSRILEMNDTRIVLESTWHFVNDPAQAYANRPWHKWTYTIYPTGQIYVDVLATQQGAGSHTGDIGLAVSVATRDGDIVHTQDQAKSDGQSQTQPYALVRFRTADAALLFMARTKQEGPSGHMVEQLHAGQDRTTVVYLTDVDFSKKAHWSAQLFLTTSTSLTDEQAQQRARAYGRRNMMELECGQGLDSLGEKTSHAWINPSTGCMSLVASRSRVRLLLPGTPQTLFSPSFEVKGPPDVSVWVYVNNLLKRQVSRNSTGELLFQLPQTIQKPTTVEVLYQQD